MIYSEFSHWKWWFSIATLNYRVTILKSGFLVQSGRAVHGLVKVGKVDGDSMRHWGETQQKSMLIQPILCDLHIKILEICCEICWHMLKWTLWNLKDILVTCLDSLSFSPEEKPKAASGAKEVRRRFGSWCFCCLFVVKCKGLSNSNPQQI